MPRDVHPLCCSFCARDMAEVERLFRSSIGGLPATICSVCVDEFFNIAQLSPQAAAFYLEERNRIAGRKH